MFCAPCPTSVLRPMVGYAFHAVGSAFHGRICVPWSDLRSTVGSARPVCSVGHVEIVQRLRIVGLVWPAGSVGHGVLVRRLGRAAPAGRAALVRPLGLAGAA